MAVELWVRSPITRNTDPQRRCYNGVNFSEETVMSAWTLVSPYYASVESAQSSAETFKQINPQREYEVRTS